MIRAFIAAEIALTVVQSISEAIGELKPRAPGIRWIPLSNLHVTLKFLGDIEEAKVDPIAQTLRNHLRPFSRFVISAKGLGVFPDPKRPRVLWVGLEGTRLAVLASAIERALEPLGFPPETRGFQPHLTIGRWRESEKSSVKFVEELGRWKNHQFGQSEIGAIILFQSMLKAEGAIHRPLTDVALSNEDPLN